MGNPVSVMPCEVTTEENVVVDSNTIIVSFTTDNGDYALSCLHNEARFYRILEVTAIPVERWVLYDKKGDVARREPRT